jgi:hypothetical protein
MGAIAFAFCWNPDNAHKTEHRAFLAQNQQPSAATEAFADAQLRPTKETQRSSLVNFPIFLSEMGQQNGNVVRALAARSRNICATRKIVFIKRRLVRVARLLGCVHLEAAMHNRNSGTGSQIGFDFGIEQAQHQTDAVDARCAVVLNKNTK